jgi:hypothetical protein
LSSFLSHRATPSSTNLFIQHTVINLLQAFNMGKSAAYLIVSCFLPALPFLAFASVFPSLPFPFFPISVAHNQPITSINPPVFPPPPPVAQGFSHAHSLQTPGTNASQKWRAHARTHAHARGIIILKRLSSNRNHNGVRAGTGNRGPWTVRVVTLSNRSFGLESLSAVGTMPTIRIADDSRLTSDDFSY